LLSCERVEEGLLWCFSAQLYPVGRSSTEEDSAYLGTMAAQVQVPKILEPVGDTIATAPNVHKWIWVEAPPAC
jgi:hypothetical protein